MTTDAPKLQINPETTLGLDRWLIAIRNPEAMETQFQLVERTKLFQSGVVTGHIMILDKDWCAVGEWIAINLWSGDPAETGQDDGPVIVTGKAAK